MKKITLTKKWMTALVLSVCGLFSALGVFAITPSTDTGEGAVWYSIKTYEGKYVTVNNIGGEFKWANKDTQDPKQLWCFIGNEAEGYSIYNKYAVAERGQDGGKVIFNVDTWASTKLPGIQNGAMADANLWELGGKVWHIATSEISDIIFGIYFEVNDVRYYWQCNHSQIEYGNSFPGTSGGWESFVFERVDGGEEPVPAAAELLDTFIKKCEIELSAAKTDPAFAEQFADAIDTFEAAINAAKAVLVNSASTEAELTAALEALKLSEVAFKLAVTPVSSIVWYHLKNMRYSQYAILGNFGGEIKWTGAKDLNEPRQIWGFEGNDVSGYNLYNQYAVNVKGEEGGKVVFNIDTWMPGNNPALPGVVNGSMAQSEIWADCGKVWHLDKSVAGKTGIYVERASNGMRYYWYSQDSQVMYSDVYGGWEQFEFEPLIPGTSIKLPNNVDNVIVYSREGSIYVQGAEGKVTITSLTGASISIDAKSSYYVGTKGIYIVKANNKAYKILVQ
jgi:hypothetical protein